MYIVYGMTWEQFWYGDPWMVTAYKEAHVMRRRMKNEEMWVEGAYQYDAVKAVIASSFGKQQVRYTAKPFEMIQHICDNLNMDGRDSGWSVGFCVESVEKTQSFSHNSVLDALNSIASLFDTEWEIIGKKINLRKVEYNK